MDFFFLEKSEKLKYIKNYFAHRKRFSVIVGETNEENNAKIAAFHSVNCERT